MLLGSSMPRHCGPCVGGVSKRVADVMQIYLEANNSNPPCKRMNYQLATKNNTWNYGMAPVRLVKPERLGYHGEEQ